MMQAGALKRRVQAALAPLACLSSFLILLACTVESYAGIPFAAGRADADLQQLARRAWVGEKQAQLELGIRFEEGTGVVRDLRQARRLYEDAARGSGGSRQAYMPGSDGARPSTVTVSTGPQIIGLAAAARRLERLKANFAPPADGFGSDDLRTLDRRFKAAAAHRGLLVYPGAAPRPCWQGSRRPSLAALLRREMASPATVMPLGCLFGRYAPVELLALARDGDEHARFVYASLLGEANGCSDEASRDALDRMSDAGSAQASIAAGNFHLGCGRVALAQDRFLLAEQQGFINARSYYRGLLRPPAPPETDPSRRERP